MKKTYIAPCVETLEFNMEAHIMGASKLEIISDSDERADGGSALSGEKLWGSSSIWNND